MHRSWCCQNLRGNLTSISHGDVKAGGSCSPVEGETDNDGDWQRSQHLVARVMNSGCTPRAAFGEVLHCTPARHQT